MSYTLSKSGTDIDTALAEQLDNQPMSDIVWDDLKFPAERTKKVSGKEPKETAYRGGQILEFEDDETQAIAFNVQFPHNRKAGSSINPHIHIVLPTDGSGSGAENIKIDMTYSWANINGTFASETTITNTYDVQDKSADTHILIPIEEILGTAASGDEGVSSMMICSLQRDHTVANNYADSFYLLEADIHYQIDQLGSREEFTK
jgi:hypothetical protein